MRLPLKQWTWQLGPPVLALAGLGLVYRQTARPVQLIVDEEPEQRFTHSARVEDVLFEAGYSLRPGDRISPSALTRLTWSGGSIPVVRLDRAAPVLVEVGGSRQLVVSASSEPAELLELAGETLYPGDRLRVEGLPMGSILDLGRLHHIAFEAAHPILLTEGPDRVRLYSAGPTLGQALWEAGITLYEGDRLDPPAQTVLDGPLTGQLTRANPIEVQLAEARVLGRSAAATVAEALGELGVPLTALDFSIPAASEPLPVDGRIQVVRVVEQVSVEQRPLAFETVYQPLDSLELDQRQLLQAGSYGVLAEQVRVRLEDGREVSRVVEGQWVAQEPTDELVGYGTQIVVRTVATADGALEYWRAVQMYATSYSPSRAGIPAGHPWFGITASGKPLTKGLVAIDRRLIPFGTRLYVPGYGFAEAADTGGGVRGRWIDLGYDDDNYVPWHQYVTVYFLTPVPPPGSIVYLFP